MGGASSTGSRVGVAVGGGRAMVLEELVAVWMVSVAGDGRAESVGGVDCGCILSFCFGVAMAAIAEASMSACRSLLRTHH